MRFPSWLVWTKTGRASSVLTAQLSVLWISWAFCVQNSKVRNICKVYGISSRENLWRRNDASSPLCHGHMFHAWGRRDCTVSWLRRWRRRNERQGGVMRLNAGTFVEASRSRLNDLKCFFDLFWLFLYLFVAWWTTSRFMSLQREVADICLTWSCHRMIQSSQSHSSYDCGVSIWKAVHAQKPNMQPDNRNLQ